MYLVGASSCIVMYRARLHAWCLHVLSIQSMRRYRLSSILDDTVSNTGVIHVSDVSRVIRRYLSGISARLDVCAVSRPPGPTYPYYAYYPYYCILPLPPLLATTPTTLQNGSDTPRNGHTYLSCIVMYFRTFPTSRNISCHPYVIHVHCT